MTWFICDQCGDSIKKPSLQKHFYQCGGQSFTCIDCSVTFNRQTVGGHSTCVTEHQKYALGATKPGGFAAQGCPAQDPANDKPGNAEPSGLEFLSTRPPWSCSVCKVSCTSRDTLLSHAAGVKHKRRAKAATAAANGGTPAAAPAAAAQQQPPAAAKSAAKRPASSSSSSSSSEDDSSDEESAKVQPKKQKSVKKPAPPSSSSSSDSSSSDDDSDDDKKKKDARPQPPAAANGSESKVASASSSEETSESEEEATAAATPAAPAAAATASPSSSDSSSSSSDDENPQPQATGKAKAPPAAQVAGKSAELALTDDKLMLALSKLLTKRLSRKSVVGPKVLRRLAAKKLGLGEGDVTSTFLDKLRSQLKSSGVCKVDGKKLVPA